MPNKSKIIGELEIKVREMCEKGYNPTHIGKQVGVAKETIKSWASKNGFNLSLKLSSKILDLEPKIIEMLENNVPRKIIQKTLNVHYTSVVQVAERHDISHLLKNKKEAALERILTREEVEAKIPDGSKYLGHDAEKSVYIFQCPKTDKIFHKTVGKIYQGSPFGKSGHRITEEEFAKSLAIIGHTLEAGTFTKTKAPVIVYCPKGHKRELNRASYAFKFECSHCSNNGTSKGELEILEWVKTYYPSATKFKFPERKTRPKEIDVFIPELKLGIEYCGLYHHAENQIEENNSKDSKHYKKMLEANKLGIRIITVFDSEWKSRKDQIKGFLLSAMQKNENKIYARECEIKHVTSDVCDDFLDKYHIQGSGSLASVMLGLFFNNELIGVMTGGQHPQRSKKDDSNIYLNRMAFISNLTVVGGASKLFGAFLEYSKNAGFNGIVSWSDNRWSEGNIYKTLGFSFDSQREKGRGLSDGSIWPELYYALNGKLYSRDAIKKIGLNEEDLNKVYDCGKKRWVFHI